MKNLSKLSLYFLTAALVSCNSKPSDKNETEGLFTKLSSDQTGVTFQNNLTFTDSLNVFYDQYFFNGGGVSAGDINNDGLTDLFFTSNQNGCKLYINKGKMKFEDATEKLGINTTGWCSGTTMADINNDGFLDIYVCRSANKLPSQINTSQLQNYLFINNKNGSFTESAAKWGLTNREYSSQATFFDMDNDGDLDFYLANHPFNWAIKLDKQYSKTDGYEEISTHRLFENLGQSFKDITKEAGVACFGFGLSCTAADINGDGFQDLYVANDYDYPDFVYLNTGKKSFIDQNRTLFKHTSLFSMGNDLNDINNDGWTDVLTADMLNPDNLRKKTMMGPDNIDKYEMKIRNGYGEQQMHNTLQINLQGKAFMDVAHLAGVAETDWSWAALMADLDNDGLKDIYFSNGYYKDYNDMDFMQYRARELQIQQQKTGDPMAGFKGLFLRLSKDMPSTKLSNYSFRQIGDLKFENTSKLWGLDEPTFSNGTIYADLDNDGDLDLVVNNISQEASVYENHATEMGKRWLSIKFKGSRNNIFGLGCKVKVITSNGNQYQELTLSRGYQSSVEPVLHFGMNTLEKAEEIWVCWPGGKVQKLKQTDANQTITFSEPNATLDFNAAEWYAPLHQPYFTEIKSDINFNHSENNGFNDFKNEFLIPQKYSTPGPRISVADVNRDGNEDFFVTNAAGSSGSRLFINQNGSFKESSVQPWKSLKGEPSSCLFFDADKDNDQDLFITCGSNEFAANDPNYADHLYINDGKGNFSEKTNAIPNLNSPKGAAAAADFDNDGDFDLFLGGAVVPGKYPMASPSFLLTNNGGVFSNATEAFFGKDYTPGIVNTAVVADFNGDKKPDIAMAGDWMMVTILKNTGKGFEKNTVAGSSGWWNCLEVADINDDGKPDLLGGNRGLNNVIKAYAGKPASVWAGDFDDNGSFDAIGSYFIGDVSYPWHSYDELASQMPKWVRSSMPRYADYAAKTTEQLLGEKASNAMKLEAETFSSAIFINSGNGFNMHAMPTLAQASSINAFLSADVNNDSKPDIIAAGNSHRPKPEHGNNDAFYGLVMLAKENDEFNAELFPQSGLYLPGDITAMAWVKTGAERKLIAANQNGKIQLYKLK